MTSTPVLMGVVNVTPDSFSDGGRWLEPDAAVEHGRRLLDRVALERNTLLASLLAELTDDQRRVIADAAPALQTLLALDLPGPVGRAAAHTCESTVTNTADIDESEPAPR